MPPEARVTFPSAGTPTNLLLKRPTLKLYLSSLLFSNSNRLRPASTRRNSKNLLAKLQSKSTTLLVVNPISHWADKVIHLPYSKHLNHFKPKLFPTSKRSLSVVSGEPSNFWRSTGLIFTSYFFSNEVCE